MPPFLRFVQENFDKDDHLFLLMDYKANENYGGAHVKSLSKSIQGFLKAFYYVNASKKIYLHGLFSKYIVLMVFLQPWLYKKITWVLWGGDLYAYREVKSSVKEKLYEKVRSKVIGSIKLITTTVPGDYELAKKWYKTKAGFIPNLMYTSHVCRIVERTVDIDSTRSILNIQVGNSADRTNQHIDVFSLLAQFDYGKVRVFCPLSYGDDANKELVATKGKELLGESFKPMLEFMSFEEYTDYMSRIDIAIFNHDRQQAMGNIIGMLSLGKTIYLRGDTTHFDHFKGLGFSIYSLTEFEGFDVLSDSDQEKNIKLAKEIFSMSQLRADWKKVFNA